jgi:hypothetical protein
MRKPSKPRKLNRHETTVARVAQIISTGRVLVAYNALANEDATVGPYSEAVDKGIRFACLSVKGRRSDCHTQTAEDAASVFVQRVGTTRANEAAKTVARQNGIELTV